MMELPVISVKVVIGTLILILVIDIVAVESGSRHWETQKSGFEQKEGEQEEDCRQLLQRFAARLRDFADARTDENDVCVLSMIKLHEFEASVRDSLSRFEVVDCFPEKLQLPVTSLDEAYPDKRVQLEIHDPEDEICERDPPKTQAFLRSITGGIPPLNFFLSLGLVLAGCTIILVTLIRSFDTIQSNFIRSDDIGD